MQQCTPALDGRCILVVEDEFVQAQALCDALEAAGAVVLGPAARVGSALELIARHAAALDAAVLDINLRGEPSYAVADALAGQGIRFVFTTGYDTGAVAAAYQGWPRLEKPLDMARLLAALVAEPSRSG